MNYEVEINKLNARLDNLQQSFIQAQKNQVPITAKTDAANNKVDAITPVTYSKMVGIQDTECVFTDVVAEGTLTANVKTEKGEYLPCSVERADSRVRVSFEKLDSVATVTIQIQ